MWDPITPEEAPDTIYLHFESNETTWCANWIDDDDVKYTKASLTEARIKELEAENARLKERLANEPKEDKSLITITP